MMGRRLRHTASWLRDRLEDLAAFFAAFIVGGGVSTKPPPNDPRNGF
jgi:hypothetical protein